MIFLTYNDHPSGVFSSQVVDVCRFLRSAFGIPVQLVCVFPSAEIEKVREKILKEDASAQIIAAKFPLSFPGLNAWALKSALKKYRGETVIARGAFACELALRMKRAGIFSKVIYDGRGAVKAEFEEYMAPGTRLARIAAGMERNAVLNSDYRIAVTHKLTEYWKSEYGYTSDRHVIIPTTRSTQLKETRHSTEERMRVRTAMGWNENDIVLAFSGGKADWQSFDLLRKFVAENFPANEHLKLLLMVPEFPPGEWPCKDRIKQVWVSSAEVETYLAACEYGLLLREKSITNKVSSPTKFAEYLHAGMKVIISPEVGDSTEMVEKNNLGFVWEPGKNLSFEKVQTDSSHIREYASLAFSKNAHVENYRKLL